MEADATAAIDGWAAEASRPALSGWLGVPVVQPATKTSVSAMAPNRDHALRHMRHESIGTSWPAPSGLLWGDRRADGTVRNAPLLAGSFGSPAGRNHGQARAGRGPGAAPATSASNDAKLQARPIQDIGAGLGADDDVLQAYSPPAGQVDARLDAEGHPGSQRRDVAGNHVRILVYFQADAVADAMRKLVAISARGDDRPRRGVNLLGLDAGTDRSRGGGLGRAHQVVDPAELWIGLNTGRAGNPDGPRRVAHVTGQTAADVKHQGLAGGDDPIARVVMRRGAVWPGSDDREIGHVVALVHQTVADLAGHVDLGAAHQTPGGDGIDRPVGSRRRKAQQSSLV